jgi:hypothetical protein
MEEREIRTLTEQEIYDGVEKAALDFLYKTRGLISRSVYYSAWLDALELFVKENMNVVVIGMVDDKTNTNFRYQHAYWKQYEDILLEIDGMTRAKTVRVYNDGPTVGMGQNGRFIRKSEENVLGGGKQSFSWSYAEILHYPNNR